jgi:hypothetical protein
MPEQARAQPIELELASGSRRAAAGSLDAAIIGATLYVRHRVRGPRTFADRPKRSPAREAAMTLLGDTALRERVGSPGERLLGVRTVDRRSGEPLALWRVAVLTAAAVAVRLLRMCLMPDPVSDEQRLGNERFAREVADLRARHADDSDALNAAMIELWRERPIPPVSVDVRRSLGVALALALVSRRLQRSLAPTAVVRRRNDPHSP